MSDTTHQTADGVDITPGLRVFSIDCKWGTVAAHQYNGWFNVDYDDGGQTLLNGERISTRDRITGSTDPRTVPPVVDAVKLTEASHNLFMALAEDAGDWSYMPPTGSLTEEQRGNLTQLKAAGLLVTQQDGGATWVLFTPKGVAYANAHDVDEIEALAK